MKIEEIKKAFKNDITNPTLFDMIFNLCLVDQYFKIKLIVEFTNYIMLLFKTKYEAIYNKAVAKRNAKQTINKNKMILYLRNNEKYVSFKRIILALRCISEKHSIVLRGILYFNYCYYLFLYLIIIDFHFKNENIVSILKSNPLIKKVTFYHITESHFPPFEIKIDLEGIEITGMYK